MGAGFYKKPSGITAMYVGLCTWQSDMENLSTIHRIKAVGEAYGKDLYEKMISERYNNILLPALEAVKNISISRQMV